ncbi:MAG TPA: hypothetical protein VI278_18520 [Nitrososphaeraceae archaeon]
MDGNTDIFVKSSLALGIGLLQTGQLNLGALLQQLYILHSENAYKFSDRATLAAGWWFYDVFFKHDFVQKIFQLLLPPNYSHKNKKAATLKIVDTFQDQKKKNGSDARIKMFGDIPIAAGWWSWLLR